MTTYTSIPNSSLEPGKPIRSIDGLALRDNPLAIIEGDATAPRIVGKAIKRIQDMPVLTVSAADTYDISNGSTPLSLLTSTTSTSYVVAFRYTIATYSGSIRLKASHTSATSGEGTNYGQLSLYKNNVLIQSYQTLSDSYVQRTNDLSCVPGDVIEWRIAAYISGYQTNFKADSQTASNGYTARPGYLSFTENLNP
jgi:hypothetical protein